MASDGNKPIKNDNAETGKKLLGDEDDRAVKKPLTCSQKTVKALKDNLLMVLTIVGVIIGFTLGFVIREFKPSDEVIRWVELPGEVFIRLLKMTIVPLIAANVICVTASLDPKENGKISVVAFIYILIANVSSAILGVTCALIVKPGSGVSMANGTATEQSVTKLTTSDVFSDLILNIFPDNILAACMFKSQTEYTVKLQKVTEQVLSALRVSSDPAASGLLNITFEAERIVSNSYSVNMIGVLFISFVFGMAARKVNEIGKIFLDLFKSISAIVSLIMTWFMWMTPPGVCFMIAGSLARVENIGETLAKVGWFIGTVTLGLVIQFFLFNIVLFSVSRRNPFTLIPYAFKAWFISFATTSPVVAIPDMYLCCDRYKISPSVSRFVIPFAAALKGDGPAVFVGAAAVFIAQATGFDLNAGGITVIALLTTTAMLALPNIPSASIVIIVTILLSLGIPIKPVGLLFAVEWLLDRLRSGNMGLGHCYCAAFTHYACIKDIRKREAEAGKNGPANDDIELQVHSTKDLKV